MKTVQSNYLITMCSLINALLLVMTGIALTGAAASEASAPSAEADLIYLGRNDRASFEFRDAGKAVDAPQQAFYIPYRNNPIIGGFNLYAPAPVKLSVGWRLYYGGWLTSADMNDEIYLSSTQDENLAASWTAPQKIIAHGIYVHVNDPSVIQKNGTWYMGLTTADAQSDWCTIVTSSDGLAWSTLDDYSHEISVIGANFTVCARPSLIWNADQDRWELYFDGSGPSIPYAQHLAYSTQANPTEFIYQQPVHDMVDADVKRVNSLYIAAYRQLEQSGPWTIQYATSEDGRTFTERGMLLEPDPLNAYDDYGVTNPGWALDGTSLEGVLFGGTSTDLSHHQIGIAFPQTKVALKSGNVSHLFSQALDRNTQRVETYKYDKIDKVSVQQQPEAPTREWTVQASKGEVYDLTSRFFSNISRTSALASTSHPEFPAGNGIDSDVATFWSSEVHSTPSASEWFAVDSSFEQPVERVSIRPRSGAYGFPVDFAIEYSHDGQAWYQLPEQIFTDFHPPNSGVISFVLDHAVSARFVRIHASRLGADNFGNYYLQIAELYPECECIIRFTDVPADHPFHEAVQRLACMGVVTGYQDHTFRPGEPLSRGQAAKIISIARGYEHNPQTQTYQDVPVGHTFYTFVEQMTEYGVASGYPCGSINEPCQAPENRPYYRPATMVTRGQISKMISNAWDYVEIHTGQTFQDVPHSNHFYQFVERLAERDLVSGYACGSPEEPCIAPLKRPYFRIGAQTSRGQFTKVVSGATVLQP